MKAVDIAKVAHEVNRAYGLSLGEENHLPWDEASDAVKASLVAGVEFRLANPDAPVSAQHEEWVKTKTADGWVYGEAKDEEAKTHPCLVEYDKLPEDQKVKDALFCAVVKNMSAIEPEKVEVKVEVPVEAKGKAKAKAGDSVLPEVNGMLPVKYVGKRDEYVDGTYGTGIKFKKGETQYVPEAKANLMFKHPDVYVPGDAKEAVESKKQSVSSQAPESDLKKTLTPEQENARLDAIMQVKQMNVNGLRNFVKTNFSGQNIPVGIKTDEARILTENLINQFGLPD
jgi:hypothetical protein